LVTELGRLPVCGNCGIPRPPFSYNNLLDSLGPYLPFYDLWTNVRPLLKAAHYKNLLTPVNHYPQG